jgi:hypothetical protein
MLTLLVYVLASLASFVIQGVVGVNPQQSTRVSFPVEVQDKSWGDNYQPIKAVIAYELNDLIKYLDLHENDFPTIASVLSSIPHKVSVDVSSSTSNKVGDQMKLDSMDPTCITHIPTYLFHFDRHDIVEEFGSNYFLLRPSTHATEDVPRLIVSNMMLEEDHLKHDADAEEEARRNRPRRVAHQRRLLRGGSLPPPPPPPPPPLKPLAPPFGEESHPSSPQQQLSLGMKTTTMTAPPPPPPGPAAGPMKKQWMHIQKTGTSFMSTALGLGYEDSNHDPCPPGAQ